MTGNHVGSGLDALDDEGTHHERHRRALGDADGHRRNKAGTRCRFSGCSLPSNAFNSTVADLVLVLAETLVDSVSRKLGYGGATSRQDAQEGPNHTAAQGAWNDALELGPGWHQLDLAIKGRELAATVEILHNLCNTEAAQSNADQAYAVGQKGQAHGEALNTAVHML